jgi:hypothetical protein
MCGTQRRHWNKEMITLNVTRNVLTPIWSWKSIFQAIQKSLRSPGAYSSQVVIRLRLHGWSAGCCTIPDLSQVLAASKLDGEGCETTFHHAMIRPDRIEANEMTVFDLHPSVVRAWLPARRGMPIDTNRVWIQFWIRESDDNWHKQRLNSIADKDKMMWINVVCIYITVFHHSSFLFKIKSQSTKKGEDISLITTKQILLMFSDHCVSVFPSIKSPKLSSHSTPEYPLPNHNWNPVFHHKSLLFTIKPREDSFFITNKLIPLMFDHHLFSIFPSIKSPKLLSHSTPEYPLPNYNWNPVFHHKSLLFTIKPREGIFSLQISWFL